MFPITSWVGDRHHIMWSPEWAEEKKRGREEERENEGCFKVSGFSGFSASYLPTIPEFPGIYWKTGVYPDILEHALNSRIFGLPQRMRNTHKKRLSRIRIILWQMYGYSLFSPELLVAAMTVTELNMLENDSETVGFIVFVCVLVQLSWDIRNT